MAKIWSLDTEDNSRGNCYFLDFYDGTHHYSFNHPNSAIEWLTKTETLGPMDIWGTNVQYDLINLFRENLSLLEISYVGSRVIIAKIRGTQIVFKCTLNHWKLSVKEMGKRIGHPKLYDDIFTDTFTDAYIRENLPKIKKRCRRDAEITWKFVNEMKSHYEKIGCELKSTIGSTALNFYYSSYGEKPTKKEIISTREMDFILRGYYGGRTEIFFNKPARGNIFYSDINSLYPSVMRDFTFPALDKRRWTKKPDFKNMEGMCDVTIKSPQLNIPYLPHRGKGKGLLFPVGQFRGVFTYYEIREATRIGYRIIDIHKALEFFGGNFTPFCDFVHDLYSARDKAKELKDELLSDSYKLLMNNLYGKFGQGNEYTKLLPYNPNELKNGDKVLGNMTLREVKGEYPRHSNGVWAAYVTAYARHRLFGYLNAVCVGGGRLIYCDTDSVVYEAKKQIIPDSKKLGEMKLEEICNYAHFKLPKLYVLVSKSGDRKYRAKGVPKAEAGNFFEKGSVKFRRPYKLRETLRRNLSPKRTHKLVANYWDTHEKVTNKIYDKREVLKDGSTRPVDISSI